MFKGNWKINIRYKKKDVVTVPVFSNNKEVDCNYYICTLNHISNNLVVPGHPEEIHWALFNFDQDQDQEQLIAPGAPKLNYEQISLSDGELNFSQDKIELPIFITEEELISNINKKRKLINIRNEIYDYKKQKKTENNLEEQLLLLDTNIKTKVYLIDKYNSTVKDKSECSESVIKSKAWFKTVSRLPFSKIKELPVNKNSTKFELNKYFTNIKNKLDEKIYGLDNVKEEILEFLARKITMPNSKGHVLALHGVSGSGKTALIRALGDALELPFNQINFGGINDVSILTGHSETYIGAKPGKIVEILENAGYSNGIVYFDEIDKISSSKKREINGILTHILDEEQNSEFQDNYLANVPIDLSKIFFVIAFNDLSEIDLIVKDRMKIIHISPPTTEEKFIIAKTKIIPALISAVNKDTKISDACIKYIINKSSELGVRQMKKNFEKIFNRINYLALTQDSVTEINICFINSIITEPSPNNNLSNMYI